MKKDNYAGAEKALLENGEFSSRTRGISMYPMLREGKDIVVIKPPVFPLKKHDVPLYRRKAYDKLILHRIIKTPKNGVYIIRGDNTYEKETVKETDIVGVLSGFFRNGRYCGCSGARYGVYVFFMRLFYPARYVWKKALRPILSKIKHGILKK